jgi:hypothetical protein
MKRRKVEKIKNVNQLIVEQQNDRYPVIQMKVQMIQMLNVIHLLFKQINVEQQQNIGIKIIIINLMKYIIVIMKIVVKVF